MRENLLQNIIKATPENGEYSGKTVLSEERLWRIAIVGSHQPLAGITPTRTAEHSMSSFEPVADKGLRTITVRAIAPRLKQARQR